MNHRTFVTAAVAATLLVSGWAASPAAGAPAAAALALKGSSLLAAGDVASCSVTDDTATADLIKTRSGIVAPLGDMALPNGSTSDFADCYTPTWGQFKSRTRPAAGNREYATPGAAPYFAYFGGVAGRPSRGYYSYTLGTWHMVVLNSNCAAVAGGCGAGSTQETWLRSDLAGHPTDCTLAYWHAPLFTSGADHSGTGSMRPLFQALYDAGAEVVLGADNRQYERFAPQDPAGAADPAHGIREFVVGTGGQPLDAFGTVAANSEVRDSSTHGILRLILGVGAYTWQFVPVAGQSFTDTGGGSCHAAPNTNASQVLLAAGDIASCSSVGDSATAAIIQPRPGTVAMIGDAVYPHGAAAGFTDCYNPTWGQFKNRTKPVPGNHEYETTGAAGYFGYFGALAGDPTKGYYSYDLGSWHILAVNSNCSRVGGCGPGSPEETWLKADLAAHPARCTLAYWHHPLFTSGSVHPGAVWMRPIFQDLYDAGADIVLDGDTHNYERFAPQTPNGVADPGKGIREWVLGMGGFSHYSFATVQPNSEVRNADTYGVLQLTLTATGYSWQFLPIAGKTFTDAGTGTCH